MSKTTYEKLNMPRYAAQATRDWHAECGSNNPDHVVLRLEPLGLARADRYVFIRVPFGQVSPTDEQFTTVSSGVFDGLELHAVASVDDRERGFYNWSLVYNGDIFGLHAIGLDKATVILDTLRYVDNALAKVRERGLTPQTFGQYVAFVCNVLGVSEAMIRFPGRLRWADMVDVVGVLGATEEDWKQGSLPEREQVA